MTLSKAEPVLSQFLEQCQQQQIRCVRIIHGKGWGSRDNKPVLKSKLNHWLRQALPNFEASLAYEMLNFLGPDAAEGLAALKEKRTPDFQNPA